MHGIMFSLFTDCTEEININKTNICLSYSMRTYMLPPLKYKGNIFVAFTMFFYQFFSSYINFVKVIVKNSNNANNAFGNMFPLCRSSILINIPFI